MQPWEQITRSAVETMVDKKANRWHEHGNYETAITKLQNLYDQVNRENQELKARLDTLEYSLLLWREDLMEHLGNHNCEGMECENEDPLQDND